MKYEYKVLEVQEYIDHGAGLVCAVQNAENDLSEEGYDVFSVTYIGVYEGVHVLISGKRAVMESSENILKFPRVA